MFRMSKPAIFGVRVEAGILSPEISLMNQQGKHIDRVKAIQSEGKGVKEAKKGQEVALSLPNITYGRQIKEGDILYSELNEFEFRKLKENKSLLSSEEMNILKEIAEIKRKEKSIWGL
jgi:translation initiation factor 5B